ncbi:MAG: FAD-binding protein [Thermoplasmatales archaeon]|nr:MAG: FAD-binding protein [Thermoplasmatales archaeon]
MTLKDVVSMEKITLDDAAAIAKKGTHCGMCKIDFLGTGLCPSGKKHGFIAYWPQGRMEIVKALASGRVKPTEKLIEIANSCSFCGICDRQCNFATQLRPEKVAKALKEYVDNLDKSDFQSVLEDDVLRELRGIVGEEWATNDPIIISSYIRTIIHPDSELNFYIVMPKNAEEISKVIKFANKHNMPFMPRSGGTLLTCATPTVLSKAFCLERGIIIDLFRLKKLEIHPESCTATVGAGITAFELQKAAYEHKLRAHLAEAGAHVCANIASTGITSTWQNRYGWAADNYVDVEIVDDEGDIKNHSDMDIKNPYTTERGFTDITLTPPGIITESIVKLHPVFDDEDVVLVPFDNLKDALSMVMKLAKRDVGLSLVILSRKYLTEFLCPTPQIAKDFEYILKNYMKLNYVVDVICNKDDKKIVEEMADYTIDKNLMKSLLLGSPRLASLKDSEFLKILSEEEDPLKAIFAGPMRKHLEKGLDASPEQIAQVFDEDLRDFFKKAYSKPEMSDIIWLHAFRILPSRLMRQRLFFAQAGMIWADDEDKILKLIDMLAEVCDKYKLEHSLGFISPMDDGKYAFFEYDYFYDHNDPDATKRVSQALIETTEKCLLMGDILMVLNYLFKGLYRKEHVLYPKPKAISKEEQELFRELIESILGEELKW